MSLSKAGYDDHNRMNRSLRNCFFDIAPASFSRPEVMTLDMSFASIFEFALQPVWVDLNKITVNRLTSQHGEYCFLPLGHQDKCPAHQSKFCEPVFITICHNDD